MFCNSILIVKCNISLLHFAYEDVLFTCSVIVYYSILLHFAYEDVFSTCSVKYTHCKSNISLLHFAYEDVLFACSVIVY